jgi:hypothetical protein
VWEVAGLSEVYAGYRDVGLRAVCGEETRLSAELTERLLPDAKVGSESIRLVGWFLDETSQTEGGRFEVTLFESRHGAIVLRIEDIAGTTRPGEANILVGRPDAEGFEQRWVAAHTERLGTAGANVVQQNQRPEARIPGRRRGPLAAQLRQSREAGQR